MSAVFRANMAALAARSPELAAIVAASEPRILELVRARSGEMSARYGSSWLHSRYDPAAEGRRVADEAVATGADLVVALGLGLGYAAQAAIAAGVDVAAIETDPAWIAALLSAVDMSDMLSDCRFSLVLCPGGDGLSAFLDEAAPHAAAIIENQATLSAFPEAAALLRDQARRYKRKDAINAATVDRFGRLWVRNLARNVRAAADCQGVSGLSGRFQGLPALVLAAGPSLDEAVAMLPALAERCLIVCVDTALRSALRAGVEPDFIVVVDPQYWNARHLDRCSSPESVLVTEAAVWPSVFRFRFKRTMLCSSIYPLGRYVENRLGPAKGALGAGGSVATTAWDFARVLGCSPIFMAGLDLSFPEGKTHAKASLFEQRSLAEGTRLHPASSASFEAMRGGKPFQATANDGSAVTSDQRLSLYSWWFSSKAAAHPESPTFNLSAKGLAIPGLAPMPILELLGLPRVRRDIAARIGEALHEPAEAGAGAAAVDGILSDLISEIDMIASRADRAVAVAEGAMASSGIGLEAALMELERIDEEVLNNSAKDVVGFFFSSLSAAVGGRAKTVDQSLERTARIYRALADSARWHAERLRA